MRLAFCSALAVLVFSGIACNGGRSNNAEKPSPVPPAPAFSQAKKDGPKDEVIKQLRAEITTLKAKIAELEQKNAGAAKAPGDERIPNQPPRDAQGFYHEDRVDAEGYAKIKVNMSLQDVENVLGPGKETSRANGRMTMRWRGQGRPPVEITITFNARFDVPTVFSKSIRDD